MKAWYFSDQSKQLRYGDGRQIRAGRTHKVKGELELCQNGLHASRNILDALSYAPGPVIWRVELGGEIIRGKDKLCASERTYLWGYDATAVLRAFARKCALDVVHLWGAPEAVARYIKTGAEPVGAASARYAWIAASIGASDWAARAARAAEAAVEAAMAARGASWDDSWAGADGAGADASAAASAANGGDVTAGNAAREKQTRRLLRMIREGRNGTLQRKSQS